MIKRALTLVNAMQITASVFINDDEYGLHQDYEKWPDRMHGTLTTVCSYRCGDCTKRAIINSYPSGGEKRALPYCGRLSDSLTDHS